MRTKNKTIRIVSMCRDIMRKKFRFELNIQRLIGQWSHEQMSMLIDTIIRGYYIPAIWVIVVGTMLTIIDGKQRCTTIFSFINDEFKLHKSIEPVTLLRADYPELEEDTTFELAGKKFSELPTIIQDIIKEYDLDMIELFDFTEEQLEEQFYRLNNGSTFTKAQTAKVLLGTELAGKINEIEDMDFFDRCAISKKQRRDGKLTTVILQVLMLLTGYEFQNFGAAEVNKFAKYYSENYRDEDLEYVKTLTQKLDDCTLDLDEEQMKFFKLINLPHAIMSVDTMMDHEYEMSVEEFADFWNEWTSDDVNVSGYYDFCGHGTTAHIKVMGRQRVMNEWVSSHADRIMLKEEGGDGENEDINTGFDPTS